MGPFYGAGYSVCINAKHETRISVFKVVFDTSILVAAARSAYGASFALIKEIPSPKFQLSLSVGLYAEWQAVLTRPENVPPGQSVEDVQAFIRFLAASANLQEMHFLWRPFLSDADEDMVLEVAFAAGCSHIVTYNQRNFAGVDRFGLNVLSPRDFLKLIRETA